MIHRVVIALSDWLRDPDTGPNAYLGGLTREVDDEALEVRSIARVLDPFRDEEAFGDKEPGAYPALIVTPASPVDVVGEVNQDEQDADPGLDVLVRVVVEEIPGPEALRELAYLLEALNKAVSGFFAETVAARAARQRGHVQIITCLARTYALASEQVGQAKVGGAMILRMSTRDTEAT